jgi:hypothetical protein
MSGEQSEVYRRQQISYRDYLGFWRVVLQPATAKVVFKPNYVFRKAEDV